jgi:hypothetical protein
MADMQTALRARIIAAETSAAGRVHWGIRPQGAPLPAVRLITISDPRPMHLKGFEDYRETGVQADCMASIYEVARALATDVINAVFPPATVDGIQFLNAGIEGPRDLGEDTAGGYVHRLVVDLLIRHGVEG